MKLPVLVERLENKAIIGNNPHILEGGAAPLCRTGKGGIGKPQ